MLYSNFESNFDKDMTVNFEFEPPSMEPEKLVEISEMQPTKYHNNGHAVVPTNWFIFAMTSLLSNISANALYISMTKFKETSKTTLYIPSCSTLNSFR